MNSTDKKLQLHVSLQDHGKTLATLITRQLKMSVVDVVELVWDDDDQVSSFNEKMIEQQIEITKNILLERDYETNFIVKIFDFTLIVNSPKQALEE